MRNEILIYLIFLMIFLLPSLVLGANTGWLNGTITAINQGSSWASPDSGWVSDDDYATTSVLSVWLAYRGFNFDIPEDAIILGIETKAEGKLSATSTYNRMSLSTTGEDGLTDNSERFTWIPTETSPTTGGSSDLWNEVWEVSDFDADFWVGCQSSNTAGLHELDNLQVRVYYFVEGNIITLAENSIASTTAYIGDLISSMSALLWLAIGIPLGFFVIKKVLLFLPK